MKDFITSASRYLRRRRRRVKSQITMVLDLMTNFMALNESIFLSSFPRYHIIVVSPLLSGEMERARILFNFQCIHSSSSSSGGGGGGEEEANLMSI
jgi:hypothetical protein